MSDLFSDNFKILDIYKMSDDIEKNVYWKKRSLCSQTDNSYFFPEKGGTTTSAKAVCSQCPVSTDCLEYALVHDLKFGVWGGKSTSERNALRKYKF
ncbi:MAG: WhiB family transcriptional regulator [Bifidobacteriaceae bacterium]|jgi:WhiB family redox-sensing transcriptional regulator|nr:WhiB family transcriptional regulator [Bifidobacteriaceae bacterium]